MERGIYDHMAAHAGSHWWYVARRQVLADVIARHVALPPARLPDLPPLPAERYDLIALLDVLEHAPEDCATLAAIAGRLVPGGSLLITVPQHQWMWSSHDVANHHVRRYDKAGLKDAFAGSGMQLRLLTSFNILLFPLAVAQRLASRISGREGRQDDDLSPPLNALFRTIFSWERHLVGQVPMSPGLSLLALATRP